jgi:hypothetical protein
MIAIRRSIGHTSDIQAPSRMELMAAYLTLGERVQLLRTTVNG